MNAIQQDPDLKSGDNVGSWAEASDRMPMISVYAIMSMNFIKFRGMRLTRAHLSHLTMFDKLY
jgi:hypothetical protein